MVCVIQRRIVPFSELQFYKQINVNCTLNIALIMCVSFFPEIKCENYWKFS